MMVSNRFSVPRLFAFVLAALLFSTSAVAQKKMAEEFETMSATQLIEALNTASRAQVVLITERLVDKKAESVPSLRDAVVKGTVKQQVFACRLLADMRDGSAVFNLLQVVNDPNMRVRLHAINALRDIGDPNAMPELRASLDNPADAETLICTLIAVGKLGGKSDIKKLQKYLAGPGTQVKVSAGVACAMLGDTSVEDILVDMTYEEDPFSSRTAVRGLGYVNTAASSIRLRHILADPNGRWKSDARIALARQELKGKPPAEQADILKRLVEDRTRFVAEWALDEIAELNIPQRAAILEEFAKEETRTGWKARYLLKIREVR